MANNNVIIFDTTLRDGEQALKASLTVKEKLQIALALSKTAVFVPCLVQWIKILMSLQKH